MNRRDRKAWRNARTLDDLGELVIRWLNGEIGETPSYLGPPEAETIPLIPALTVINRGGFITENSQLADTCETAGPDDGECGGTCGRTCGAKPWNTWVDGFAADAVLARLREAVAGTPLILTACRGPVHEHDRAAHWNRCLRRQMVRFWAEECPDVEELGYSSGVWFVSVSDPEPGRNDLLWDTLTRALAGEVA